VHRPVRGASILTALLVATAPASARTPPSQTPPTQTTPTQTPGTAPASTVTLHGLRGEIAALSVVDLARMPQVHITLTHMGRTSDYAGPELAALLRQVDAPLGARMHGRAVATAVLVTASDGYRTVLSLGEVDPELRPGARVILADQEDGRPLPPNEAPARLVIDGDAKPARDAHSVISIDLRQLP
jgi:hypothetical protein